MASGAVRACCFIGYKKPTRGELRERSTQEQLPTSFFFASSCSMSRSMCAASRGGAGERVGRVLRSVFNTGQRRAPGRREPGRRSIFQNIASSHRTIAGGRRY